MFDRMNHLDDTLHMVLDQQAAMRHEARLFRLAREGRTIRRRRPAASPLTDGQLSAGPSV